MLFDYLLYIAYRFLVTLNGVQDLDLKGRSINAVALILSIWSVFILSLSYMIVIKTSLLAFNKPAYLCSVVASFVVIYICLKLRCREKHQVIINRLAKRFNYSDFTNAILFLSCFFLSLFTFWLSIILYGRLLFS